MQFPCPRLPNAAQPAYLKFHNPNSPPPSFPVYGALREGERERERERRIERDIERERECVCERE